MTDYEGDSQLISVAHSCRSYKAGKMGAKMSAASEGLSCSSCINWGTSGCMRSAFDSLSSDLDYM